VDALSGPRDHHQMPGRRSPACVLQRPWRRMFCRRQRSFVPASGVRTFDV